MSSSLACVHHLWVRENGHPSSPLLFFPRSATCFHIEDRSWISLHSALETHPEWPGLLFSDAQWVSLAHIVPLRAPPGQKPGFLIQTENTPDFSVRQLSITKVLVVLVVLVSSTYSSGGSSSSCCCGGGNTSSSSCCCGSLVAWDICAPGPAAPVLPPLLLRDDLHTHPCCGSGRMKQKKSICPFQFCFKGLFFWCFFYRFADLKQLWLSEIKR